MEGSKDVGKEGKKGREKRKDICKGEEVTETVQEGWTINRRQKTSPSVCPQVSVLLTSCM